MARASTRSARGRRLGIALVALLALSACSEQFRNHGYVPGDDQLAEVLIGLDDRASVAEVLGAPTAGGVLDGDAFYYVQSRFRHFAFFEPQEVDRQVVAISFDAEGLVSNVERFGLEDGQVVALSRRVTSSSVRDTTFLRQLLGALGNFDASRVLGSE
ncbi:MAG: Beta-barrel assembly machine subunit BamE [Rhodobacteraceae bacterium HLUCCA08]|nr:MAG: Beta-barrel assembly machine subunit BamE [Rhodobacteraceae bacterium HLUCCA08]